MYIDDLLYQINNIVDKYIATMGEVSPDEMGLDRRSAYSLYVNNEGIAVKKDKDSSLQYYGGFEYVDKELRFDLGEYVFYMIDRDSTDGCRVQECIDRVTHTESYYIED